MASRLQITAHNLVRIVPKPSRMKRSKSEWVKNPKIRIIFILYAHEDQQISGEIYILRGTAAIDSVIAQLLLVELNK